MRKITLISLLIFSLGCSGDDNNKYTYKEMIEIFAVTQYLTDVDYVNSIISDKFNFIDTDNQIKYNKSFDPIMKTEKKWNHFIKDTIEYFIKMDKKLTIKYYHPRGYERGLNLFNDNFLIDPKKQKPPKYWKVFLSTERLPRRYILIKELYVNNKLKKKFYYDENRFRLKEVQILPQKKEVSYFFSNRRIK